MLGHMFEGLMKWEDSGVEANGSDGTANNAALTYGQAASYEKAENADGTVTYTFTLRDDAMWSDGQPSPPRTLCTPGSAWSPPRPPLTTTT